MIPPTRVFASWEETREVHNSLFYEIAQLKENAKILFTEATDVWASILQKKKDGSVVSRLPFDPENFQAFPGRGEFNKFRPLSAKEMVSPSGSIVSVMPRYSSSTTISATPFPREVDSHDAFPLPAPARAAYLDEEAANAGEILDAKEKKKQSKAGKESIQASSRVARNFEGQKEVGPSRKRSDEAKALFAMKKQYGIRTSIGN